MQSAAIGGDFASIFASLNAINQADVVFATADSLAIPLLLLKHARLLRPPLVYTPIGLPERLAQLRNGAPTVCTGALCARAHGHRLLAAEADRLRDWIGAGVAVVFLPFGVDRDFSALDPSRREVDVVAIGADPRRDFALLMTVAARPAHPFRIVATPDHIRALGAVPSNVVVETDIPLEAARIGSQRRASSRCRFAQTATPVRRRCFLQAMALAKPVVVSRTDAIERATRSRTASTAGSSSPVTRMPSS